MRLTPPQDAKKLADVLASTKRVAIFLRTLDSLNGCYLGDQDDDDRSWFLTEFLTDIEKKVGFLLPRLNDLFDEHTVSSSVHLHTIRFPFMRHVIYGRMAFGLSMQGVGGLNL
ncbi:LOW QUALITY PROTEIN: Hypothetical protein PHPALM_8632 [Phytophthora palmivora]|uniref:Uncharacterized protein n=1 Tax=Phytophthora palmivora TaxID=4796 RepID=A0A2P4Y9C7_9STRA|nr:LOW QUALITY PROTEIN: Hypothetical protein PHPALM_8632 [Phytophthora palmivora]